ncbi:hypothetical protein HBI56_000130 [Parastagonospora nodorum]|uniref:Uncharacterized protein n=1 Tax=Phaeosphaeria nodorum (strain SN15 / ATCC MYA-4574 / FGSC 10173) TaxID=321614 RepID=A0A7U2ERR5_PHANO|nr:hypothetical protein HBH56_140950 [Parastagonospora nodorum]QRC91592.1 hypothetical protein JI435_401450 [Parastagonospora nodorum SN15]KAH3928152.1 hypothetical protein HBH54_146090 [Parastagonospora nodorum]KAH3972313.1 hypothetical protein HBH52_149160 [Parastagonospora nodorum]KAH3983570.1 hypothetical protein HBH51_032060 [Parastagonospora nodorum]
MGPKIDQLDSFWRVSAAEMQSGSGVGYRSAGCPCAVATILRPLHRLGKAHLHAIHSRKATMDKPKFIGEVPYARQLNMMLLSKPLTIRVCF